MIDTTRLPSARTIALAAPRRLDLRAALVLVWLLALPPLWLSLVAAPAVRVEVGQWGDHTVLSGVNGIEQAATEDYRWTTALAELALPNLSGRYELLRMRAHGWRPDGQPSPAVRLEAAGRPWGELRTTPGLRVYSVLLPHSDVSARTRVAFASDTYSPPGDPREIGFALDWAELRALSRAGVPAPLQLGGQALLLALGIALLWLLRLPAGPTLGATLALVAGVIGANLWQPLWVGLGLVPWLLLAAALLAATWLVGPVLARWLAGWMSPAQARAAWALVLAVFALRLLGAAHPFFDARDMPVHTRWLGTVAAGELYLYSTPAELQNRKTFNPPAGYVLLLPLRLLLPEQRLAVQVGTALLDALGCALLLPVARELRMGPRAALLGLALALALPINMTMMWWGFAANAIAQSLWLLLLWLLLRLTRDPTPRGVVLATVAAALCLTTHVGALVLLVATLGLVAALAWRALPRRAWGALLLAGGLALALMVPVYFAAAAAPLGGEERSPASLDLAASFAKGVARLGERVGLVGRALTLGWLPPVIALAPLGLGLLWAARERHPLQRLLLAASLAVCAVFFGTYLFLGLLTRYIYFVTPLVCLAAGAVLAPLWALKPSPTPRRGCPCRGTGGGTARRTARRAPGAPRAYRARRRAPAPSPTPGRRRG
jgi:toxin CptA